MVFVDFLISSIFYCLIPVAIAKYSKKQWSMVKRWGIVVGNTVFWYIILTYFHIYFDPVLGTRESLAYLIFPFVANHFIKKIHTESTWEVSDKQPAPKTETTPHQISFVELEIPDTSENKEASHTVEKKPSNSFFIPLCICLIASLAGNVYLFSERTKIQRYTKELQQEYDLVFKHFVSEEADDLPLHTIEDIKALTPDDKVRYYNEGLKRQQDESWHKWHIAKKQELSEKEKKLWHK